MIRQPVYAEVEIDSCEIEAAGYHHEDDCPAKTGPTDADRLHDAITALHRQAHPQESLDPRLCYREPCLTVYPPSGGKS